MSFEERFEKIQDLSQALGRSRRKIVDLAVRDLQFTVKDSNREVDLAIDRLQMYEQVSTILRSRVPLGGHGSCVSLMLSYNGSTWVNTAITSSYIVGNKVRVKFSSKARNIMAFTETIYRPIFGTDITFYKGSGKSFLEESLKSPEISAVVAFGFDENILPYQEAFKRTEKKLVFEGPGQDPFIVFADADLESAVGELVSSKFMYSGQTCTAPKRIFVQHSIYEEFLQMFADKVKHLVVGDPGNQMTDVSPVASGLAVERITRQLEDAVEKGGEILVGGKIEGRLIYPTVVKNSTDDMLGMKEEVFGPVAFTSSFVTAEEVIARAQHHKYGLRAAVYGGTEAQKVARALKGEDYCHPVADYTFGKFGTAAHNQSRTESWRGALIVKAVGGYGYSGWVWETTDGRFQIKQGPKLLTIETSAAG